jgi:hypothetical protein
MPSVNKEPPNNDHTGKVNSKQPPVLYHNVNTIIVPLHHTVNTIITPLNTYQSYHPPTPHLRYLSDDKEAA